MKKITFALVVAVLLSGCLSSSENDAIKTLKNVYETSIGFTKGMRTGANGDNIRYFGVKLAEGRYVNMLAPEITAGNVAIYTYKNLDESDKTNRTHLTVSIKKGEKEINRVFPMTDMAAPAEQAIVFEKFSLAVRDRRYDEAAAMIEKKFYKPGDGKALQRHIEKYEQQNGNIKASKRIGFGLRKLSGKEFFEYNGVLLFENGKCLPYTVHTFKDPANKVVANYNFESVVL